MVPVEVHRYDPRRLLAKILNDGKMVIFNPLHSHVYDLSGYATALEKVSQSEEAHGQEIDPDEMIDRPVIVDQLGDMEKNNVRSSHRGNCKMLIRTISTSSKKLPLGAGNGFKPSRIEMYDSEFLALGSMQLFEDHSARDEA
jgi:hypothetical protein